MTALAARGGAIGVGTHPYSSSGQPTTTTTTKLPPRPKRPSEPKPTEIPLEQLKKNPKFRKLSSRWTKLIFALPVAIVSSYALWEKYDEQQAYQAALQAKRSLQDSSGIATTTATTTTTVDNVKPVSTETTK
ncbi:hypothetical protein H2204_011684 [Knufia peltigerae]|uniref:Uncharacterized protein n=1 Tax=Knufia peltigerae TaxID=1002370 RepID=A0AA38XTV3_9EURO|nr:hypothetical protein H2204_011684 [Knufia peltigerae]